MVHTYNIIEDLKRQYHNKSLLSSAISEKQAELEDREYVQRIKEWELARREQALASQEAGTPQAPSPLVGSYQEIKSQLPGAMEKVTTWWKQRPKRTAILLAR